MPPRDDANLARIRDNQRRSRARRKEYLQDLEQRVRAYDQLGVEASAEVQLAARRVADENRRLRALLQREHGVSAARIEAYLQAGRAAEAVSAPVPALAPAPPLDQLMGPRFLPVPPGGTLLSGTPGSPSGPGGGGVGGGGGSSEDDDAAGGAASALSTDESAGGGGGSGHGHGHSHGHHGPHGHHGHHGHHAHGHSDRGRKTKRGSTASASPSSFPGAAVPSPPHPPVAYASTSAVAVTTASSFPPTYLLSSYRSSHSGPSAGGGSGGGGGSGSSSFYETLDAGSGEEAGLERQRQHQHQQQPSPLQAYTPVDPLFFDYGLAPPYSGGAPAETCPTCMAGLVCSLHGYYEG